MSDAPSVSVIVASRGRPGDLRLCFQSLEQLYYPNFEIVVVADPAGCVALDHARGQYGFSLLEFDEANISAARNLGLCHAAGDIVAFIDDDAVAEPTWLNFLAQAFADPRVMSAGGYVRGRNGISFQHKARRVDALGRHSALSIEGDGPVVLETAPGDAVKTEGTNCAFRRDVLLGLGGFDIGFRFYLDETDVNLRLAGLRHAAAIAPLAQVHHKSAASDQRNAERRPNTLFDVGASYALFLRKHADAGNAAHAMNGMRRGQRARMLRLMVSGACEPRDVGRMLATFEDGVAAGRARDQTAVAPIEASARPFRAFRSRFSGGHKVIAGRQHLAKRHRSSARQAVSNGSRTSLLLLNPTTIFHKIRFTSDGYWEQRGGIYGKSQRTDPIVKFWKFGKRVARESARIKILRTPPDG